MNDLGLAAAMMARHKAGDPSRYDGWVGLSALPGAPVIESRPRRRWWRLRFRPRVAQQPRLERRATRTAGTAVVSG
jgi:hypothetical protein